MSITPQTFIYYLFFFNDTATTEIYTLSLHDALPIYLITYRVVWSGCSYIQKCFIKQERPMAISNATLAGLTRTELLDRKSTRLKSSHSQISYSVFSL